ncbi:hypothetical protein [Leifsonia sp. Leaf264]|uniref:hypothetical protein n=1 Tax=Leifsonia sp. Leaf264 TaxID=1736314 RepID=UPI0006F7A179|nr:hypothetical protein [Leifsonia sp. Leaf264]KQO98412.1 hypothetical protein ASF30_10145 [Leifsonia sp. Leaf264]
MNELATAIRDAVADSTLGANGVGYENVARILTEAGFIVDPADTRITFSVGVVGVPGSQEFVDTLDEADLLAADELRWSGHPTEIMEYRINRAAYKIGPKQDRDDR